MWIIREEPNGITHWEKARTIRRRSDNMFAYCVEPFEALLENTDMSGSALNISEEIWQRVELLSYYGYMYGDHTDIKWYSITQMMIWKTVNPSAKFYYTHGANGTKWEDRFASEMNEIEQLISEHYLSPNFNGNKFQAIIGQELRLTDTNNVLKNYKVLNNNNISTRKEGNQLVITPHTVGEVRVILENKDELLSTPAILYQSPSGQDVMIRGSYDPLDYPITLNVLGGRVTIHKQDKDTLRFEGQGDAILSEAVYGVYKEDGSYVTEIITDRNGYANINYLPSLGRFFVQEKTASIGYELDKTKYYFELNANNLEPELTVQEKVIEREFTFFKVYAQDSTGFLTGEPNITFDIYLKSKKEKYASFTTNKDGYATVKLPYGVYVVSQVNSTENYEKMEDFEIEVNDKLPQVSYKLLSNAGIKAKLKVVKVDEETDMVIPVGKIKFKIRNLDTNEYVCQTITYPNVTQICDYETTEDGILYTPFPLLSGNYELEELDQPLNGYLWNTEPLKFIIGDNSPIINDEILGPVMEVRFPNKQVKGKIEIHKKGEKVEIKDGNYEYIDMNLSNVKFEIRAKEDIVVNNYKYYSKGELVATLITEDGYAYIDNLALGIYTVQEISTTFNHILDDKIYEVNLLYQDQYTQTITKDIEIKNYLPKGTLEFTKTDLASSKPIPDTKIEIFTEQGEKIFSGITDQEGKIIIDNLWTGKFYIVETEPATGYRLSDEIVYFEITENGEVVKANMVNEKITGKLKFTKLDENGNPIAGVSIHIFKNDGTLVGTYITNSEGLVIIEALEYGNYSIKEIATVDGYELSDETILFSITEDNKEVNVSMVNKKLPYTNMNDNLNYVAISLIGIGFIFFIIIRLCSKKRK